MAPRRSCGCVGAESGVDGMALVQLLCNGTMRVRFESVELRFEVKIIRRKMTGFPALGL